MSIDPEEFKSRIDSFIQYISVPRKATEELQVQCQNILVLIVNELSKYNEDNLDIKLIIFCRSIWDPLVSYLVSKYKESNVINFLNNQQGFNQLNLKQVVKSGSFS